MGIYIMNHGIYPRSQGLAKAISRYGSGKISLEDLDRIYDKYTARFLKLVEGLGYDRYSDGMLRWDDIFNPLISGIEGVRVNGLRRFYDNNYFFRQPIVVNKISYGSPIAAGILGKSAKIAREIGTSIERLSLTLPGPYTMAMNSIIEARSYNIDDFMVDYADKVIYREALEAMKLGVVNIDLHEPSLAISRNPPLEVLEKIYLDLARRLRGAIIWVITYFGYNGDAASMLARISRNAGNLAFMIDLVDAGEKVWSDIADHVRGTRIGLAIVDSRTTKLESYRDAAENVLRLIKMSRDYGDVYLTHNASMEFLPERVAVRKLRLLRRIALRVRERIRGSSTQ